MPSAPVAEFNAARAMPFVHGVQPFTEPAERHRSFYDVREIPPDGRSMINTDNTPSVSFDVHTTVYTDAVVIKIEITGADADARALAEQSVIEAVKNLSN